MEYEEYLEKFCTNETRRKRTGDTYRLRFSWRLRLKLWLLKRKGYLLRLETDYHHRSVDPEDGVSEGKGFGFLRIHKYLPTSDIPDGVEIEEGPI